MREIKAVLVGSTTSFLVARMSAVQPHSRWRTSTEEPTRFLSHSLCGHYPRPLMASINPAELSKSEILPASRRRRDMAGSCLSF